MSVLSRWVTVGATTSMAISIALQVTLVVGVAWVLDRLLARRAAAARHAVWLCALLMTLLGPVVVFVMDRAGVSLATIGWEMSKTALHGRAQDDLGREEPRPLAPPVLAEELGNAPRTTSRSVDADMASATDLRPGPPGRPAVRAAAGSGDPRRTGENAAGSEDPRRTDRSSLSGDPRPTDRSGPDPVRRGSPDPAVGATAGLPPPGTPSPASVAPPSSGVLAGAIVAIWLLGVVVLGARLIRGMLLLGSLRRSARPVEADELGCVPDRIRAALGVGELPKILVSSRIAGPVAVGVLGPAVILPDGLLEAIGEEALRDILLHECAHLVRRDPIVGLVQRVVELIYWPHPMVHLLNRRLSRTREEACDDIVLSRGDAVAYACTLLAMAERFESVRRPRGALALMNPRWKLEERVAGLLDPRRTPMIRVDRRGLIAVALTLVLTTVAGAGVRWGQAPAPAVAAGDRPGGAQPASGRSAWSIPGLVVDEAGKPVAGAAVRVLRAAEQPEEAISGPDGSFVIRANGPMEQKVELIASADGGRRQGLGPFRESIDSKIPSAPARIVLEPSRSVAVNVTGADGKPAPEAGVEVIARGSSVASGRTDADGQATLLYPSRAEIQSVVALKPGAGLDYYENYRSSPAVGDALTLPGSISLVLDGAMNGRVKAVDAGGNPVPGVVLRASWAMKPSKLSSVSLGESRFGWARTDGDGIAVLDWMPADLEGSISIAAASDRFVVPSISMAHFHIGLPVVTLPLIGTVPLRGKVVHADGQPAAGILVKAAGTTVDPESLVVEAGRLARTGTDGTYEIMVPAGHTYILGVEDQTWAAKSQVGITMGDEPRIVPDLRLIRGTLIRGQFRLSADDRPVAGYAVYLLECGAIMPADPRGDIHRTRESLIRHVDTDAEGRFTFRIGPGVYAVTITQGELVDRFERVVNDEDAIEVALHLVGGESRVTGQVQVTDRAPTRTSQVMQRAKDLVRRTFGPDHWTVTSDLPYVYYNTERRFWMFARSVEEIQQENGMRYDGKRLRMRPFAVIWKSDDGKSVQRLTAESATLDFNQSIRLVGGKPNTEGLNIERAHLEGDVRFVDDRGTPAVPADDLRIGPMAYLDYVDATRQITSESHVDIVDPDQKTSGDGLVIQLRKPDPNGLPASSAAGFGAVEYAILLKNPRVTLRDVGNPGVFGTAPAGKTATPAKAGAATIAVAPNPTAREAGATDARKTPAEPVPLYIKADGKMRVDWPPNRLPAAGGLPAPPAPTLVRFEGNVIALHGRTDRQPDQLDCDTLRLTLVPGPQPARGDKNKPNDKDKADKDRAPDRRAATGGPPAPATPPLLPSEPDLIAFPPDGVASATVPGAIVMVLNGEGTWGARALTESQGRFALAGPARSVIHAGGAVLYARSPDGSRAGLAKLKPDQDNVSIELHEAASISGQVVDDNGQPAASRAVELELYRDGARSPSLPELRFSTLTDDKGRYRFTGLPTGTQGNVSLETHGLPEPDSIWWKAFRVYGPTPIALPNLIVANPGTQTAVKLRPGEVPGRRPPTVKPIEMPRPATVPAGPSRAEVEALLRALGRDPVTPTLVDRVIARFHPRLRPPPFHRVRQLATDPEFVRHMDELTREVLHRPLDTIMLLRCAIEYRVGHEDSFMKQPLRDWADSDRAARITIRGKVEEEETRRPIQGAQVSTDIHDFTDAGFVVTDDQGRFKLEVPPRSTWYLGSMELNFDMEYVPLWVEADGRASALRFVPLAAAAGDEDQGISMKPETPFFGAVVDPSGRPVASAVVELITTRAASMTGGPSPGKLVSLDGTFAVLTDSQGRFSFAGLPAHNPNPVINLGVTHPEFLAISWTDLEVAIDPKTRPMIVMEPGCTVSGVVVNRRGDPISGASVRVPGQEFPEEGLTTTLTDRDGCFQLRNVKPGRRIVLAQSRRLAASWSLVVAHPDRPVQNQFVLQPGESVTGKVIGPGNKPASGAWVGVSLRIPSDGTDGEELHLNASTLTAEDGSFRLSALPSGELKLRAGDETQELNGEVRVTGMIRDVVITLKEPEPLPRK